MVQKNYIFFLSFSSLLFYFLFIFIIIFFFFFSFSLFPPPFILKITLLILLLPFLSVERFQKILIDFIFFLGENVEFMMLII